MKKFNKHLFHVLEPSLWPFFLASGIFFFVTGLAFSIHYINKGYYLIILSICILLFISLAWFLDISREAVIDGFHSQIVRNGIKLGFLFFIVSEIMLFFGFFWAFFHASLSPSIEIGSIWPPRGLNAIAIFEFPLYNTFLLIISGFSVTWAHRGICLGFFRNAIDGLLLTICLGLFFILLQGLEYYDSTFNLSDGVYTCVFFLLTGLHGLHVIIGVIFLFGCLVSLFSNSFLDTHYLRFILAVWYWHFVDIVWILLFLTLYCWGSW